MAPSIHQSSLGIGCKEHPPRRIKNSNMRHYEAWVKQEVNFSVDRGGRGGQDERTQAANNKQHASYIMRHASCNRRHAACRITEELKQAVERLNYESDSFDHIFESKISFPGGPTPSEHFLLILPL
jgi:hypothetical protein